MLMLYAAAVCCMLLLYAAAVCCMLYADAVFCCTVIMMILKLRFRGFFTLNYLPTYFVEKDF